MVPQQLFCALRNLPRGLQKILFTLPVAVGILTACTGLTEICTYPQYLENAGNMAYKMAGIKNPRTEIDFAEVYDPFDYKELHHMEGLQLAKKGEAPKMTTSGITQRNGELPINPSGGLLGVGNPIAAAGMMKVCELYFQLTNQAGKRQVKKEVHTGLAQAWGDLMQYSSVFIMKRR